MLKPSTRRIILRARTHYAAKGLHKINKLRLTKRMQAGNAKNRAGKAKKMRENRQAFGHRFARKLGGYG